MAQVIGHISEISGLFYAKDSSGETRLLKLGDELFVGEIVVGDDLNSAENILKFSVNGNGKEISVLADNQLLLDSTILPVELALDNVVQPQDIEEALLLDATYSDDELAAKTAEELPISAENLDELEAPAAGDAEVDTLVGRFSDRTAGETDISTDLRDASFVDPAVAIADDGVDEVILEDAIVSLSATPQLTEDGGIITYTATLDIPAVETMTVTLSNGETITIEAGAITGTVNVTVAEEEFEDVYIDSDIINVTITETTGGGFATVDYTTNSEASTAIVDTIDATMVTVSNINAELVTEDTATVTYEVKVDNPVTNTPLEVTVELMDGDTDDVIGVNTITIPVGAISASGDIELTEDYSDVYNDSGSIKAIIVGTSGGNYEALDTTSTDVTSLEETIDTTTLTLADVNVNEGTGTATIDASLNNPTDTAMTVTLSNGATISFAAGTSTATSTTFAIQGEDPYVDGESYDVSVVSTTGGNFEDLDTSDISTVTISDVDQTTTLSLAGDAIVTEGGTATYILNVDNAPQNTPLEVQVQVSHIDTDNDDLTPVIQTVEIPVGSTSVEFTVDNIDDSTLEGYEKYNVEIVGTSGGNYENLIVDSSSVDTTIADNDVLTLFEKIVINEINLGNEAEAEEPYIEIVSIVDNASETTGSIMSILGLEIVGADGQVITIAPGFIDKTVPARSFLVINEDGTWQITKPNGGVKTDGTWDNHATVYDPVTGITSPYDPDMHSFNFGSTTIAPLSVNLLQTNGVTIGELDSIDYFVANNPQPATEVSYGTWIQPVGDYSNDFTSFNGDNTDDTSFVRVFRESGDVETDTHTADDWSTTSNSTPLSYNETQVVSTDPDAPDAEDGQTITFGTLGDDTIEGGAGPDFLYGDEGNDTLSGGNDNDYLDGGAGDDTINAGAGDDTIVFDSADVVDGGTGDDTLLIDSGSLLDFSTLVDGKIINIENVDLRGGSNTTVENVTLESVFDMTDSNNVLHILGDSGDKVQSDDTGWSKVGTAPMDGITYNQYEGTYYDGTDNHTVYVNVQDTIDEEIV